MTAKGWQVIQVSYSNTSDLRYKLAGVDTVISTINGDAQLALIHAAAAAHVRRFVPSEFEGSPTARSTSDIFDCGRRAALGLLQQYESRGMRFAVFTCGVFYERFAPGGMRAYQIGLRSAIGGEGEYIMDIRNGKAMIPYFNSDGQPVYVCMTSARDMARFLVASLELSSWPRELRLRGDRMTVSEIVSVGEALRGEKRNITVICQANIDHLLGRDFERANYTKESLQDVLTVAQALRDETREQRIQHLITTAEGRYDFSSANLNSMVNIVPQTFQEWLVQAWSS
jgi:nucleoside-diphosphate-sugar epimerase